MESKNAWRWTSAVALFYVDSIGFTAAYRRLPKNAQFGLNRRHFLLFCFSLVKPVKLSWSATWLRIISSGQSQQNQRTWWTNQNSKLNKQYASGTGMAGKLVHCLSSLIFDSPLITNSDWIEYCMASFIQKRGAVASFLARSAPDQAVWIRVLAELPSHPPSRL